MIDPNILAQLQQEQWQTNPEAFLQQPIQQQDVIDQTETLLVQLINETIQDPELNKETKAKIINSLAQSLHTVLGIQLDFLKFQHQQRLDEQAHELSLLTLELKTQTDQEKIKQAQEKATLDTMTKLAQQQSKEQSTTIAPKP